MYRLLKLPLYLLAGAVLAGCSLMETDRSDCPESVDPDFWETGHLRLSFVYDWNIERGDLFKDQVGCVQAMLFDEAGTLVQQQTVANTPEAAPLQQYGATLSFDDLVPGRYQVLVVAQQASPIMTRGGEVAKFRCTPMTAGSHIDDFQVALDATPAADGMYDVSSAAPLDTLWMMRCLRKGKVGALALDQAHDTTLPADTFYEQTVEVEAGVLTYATASLVRDTKLFNISLQQLDTDPADMDASRYGVEIVGPGRVLDRRNALASDEMLRYTPCYERTSQYPEDGEPERRAAHYNLTTSRIFAPAEGEPSTFLRIYNKETGAEVCYINLPAYLDYARPAYEWYRYTSQEYLDREHVFTLDFFLRGDRWEYVDIRIEMLSWSKRVQFSELGS